MAFAQSFTAAVDIFPNVGPAFRNEPALIEVYISDRLNVLGISTCCADLTETPQIADFFRTEFTEKGHKKFTSLLWGTLVIKTEEPSILCQCQQFYDKLSPTDDHFRINASNIKVDADSGTIAIFRWAHEQDALSASQDWYERFIESHFYVRKRGNF